jgi:tryptophan synthase alpha chain
MIEAGADAVEIGLPFSDPMLDGRTIQQASAAAISRGESMARILGQLGAAAAGDVPLIAMTYANHAYSRGLPAFCRQLADAGLSGVIIPDLPAAEAGDYLEAAGQAAAAARHADGVIVASALMRRVLDGASSASIGRDVAALRTALDQARS